MFSNPALASSVSDNTVGLNYMNYMHGANYMGASYTKALGEKATIAGGILYMNYGKMKQVDENNVQTGTFNASDIALEESFRMSWHAILWVVSRQNSLLLTSETTTQWLLV